MDGPQSQTPSSLAEEQKELTRARIRRAAMEVVAERGLDATVEEIARVSGVSPRTIFRHYATQGSLIVATVKDMFEACGRRPIESLPDPTDDLEGWLDGLAVTIHTRNAVILGQAFWDLHHPKLQESEALAEVAVMRGNFRRTGVRYLAALAWPLAGGTGDPPELLIAAFALNFSAFATQALMIDFDQTPAQIGTLTATIVKMMLFGAVQEQRAKNTTGASPATTGEQGGDAELRLGIAEAMHTLMGANPVDGSPE
jgi:AcrR family transcriptional regulator